MDVTKDCHQGAPRVPKCSRFVLKVPQGYPRVTQAYARGVLWEALEMSDGCPRVASGVSQA